MKECITHFACDCLIAKIERLEKENQVMEAALNKFAEIQPINSGIFNRSLDDYLMANEALAKVRQMRGEA